MAPTSGLVDMFEKMGILSKVGNKLAYTSKETGEIVAEFRKNWTEDKLMQIMNEWDNSIAAITTTVETDDEEAA
jgi:hypothetical protein